MAMYLREYEAGTKQGGRMNGGEERGEREEVAARSNVIRNESDAHLNLLYSDERESGGELFERHSFPSPSTGQLLGRERKDGLPIPELVVHFKDEVESSGALGESIYSRVRRRRGSLDRELPVARARAVQGEGGMGEEGEADGEGDYLSGGRLAVRQRSISSATARHRSSVEEATSLSDRHSSKSPSVSSSVNRQARESAAPYQRRTSLTRSNSLYM